MSLGKYKPFFFAVGFMTIWDFILTIVLKNGFLDMAALLQTRTRRGLELGGKSHTIAYTRAGKPTPF
jgi:hypothetical protein